MATLLLVEQMDTKTFLTYHDCLRDTYGGYLADIVLGPPREVEIPTLDENRIHHSYQNQICALCSCGIPEEHKEDCEFERVAEKPMIFFLCDPCQGG